MEFYDRLSELERQKKIKREQQDIERQNNNNKDTLQHLNNQIHHINILKEQELKLKEEEAIIVVLYIFHPRKNNMKSISSRMKKRRDKNYNTRNLFVLKWIKSIKNT